MSYFMYENTNVFYKVLGEGDPLLIIHGDTASSKMLAGEGKFYSKYFKVIMVDLMGQGKSQRLDVLPINYWEKNGEMLIMLCRHIGLEKVNLLGTSGGAIVALNAVLKDPHLFSKIVADSFIGETLSYDYVKEIIKDREESKRKLISKIFWFIMHGSDWEKVVDQNTKLIESFAKLGGHFFCDYLGKIKNNLLITASEQDHLLKNIRNTMDDISGKMINSEVKIFPNGNHPALLSNKKEYRKLLIDFLK